MVCTDVLKSPPKSSISEFSSCIAASALTSKGAEASTTMAPAELIVSPKPPVSKKVSHVLKTHDDEREDNYYWIRDDERKDPEVLAYLNEENDYTEAVMTGELSTVFCGPPKSAIAVVVLCW